MVDLINVQGQPFSVPQTGGGGGLGDLFGNNPGLLGGLGALGGAGLGAGIGALLGQGQLPYKGQLEGLAGEAGGMARLTGLEGAALVDPLISGNLPPGAEAQVQQALKQATATTKGRYANLGQTGSTMEGDALSNLQNQTSAMRFQIAQQMAQAGLQAQQISLSAMGLEDKVWSGLMKSQMDQDKNMSDTIGSFAKMFGSALGTIGGASGGASSLASLLPLLAV